MITRADLVVGRVFRARKPAPAGQGYFNDRQLVHVGMFEVQYDGPAVAHGRHYPNIEIDKFIAWAHRDVTKELPEGEWQEYGT